MRLELILQEEKIQRLRNQILDVTRSYRKSERFRKREQNFLETLIAKYKGDNVPLSVERCHKYCIEHKVKTKVCNDLCKPKPPPCTFIHDPNLHSTKKPKYSIEEILNRTRRYIEDDRSPRHHGVHESTTVVLSSPPDVIVAPSMPPPVIPRPISDGPPTVMPPPGTPLRVPVFGALTVRSGDEPMLCERLTCVVDSERTRTVCLEMQDPALPENAVHMLMPDGLSERKPRKLTLH